MFEGRKGKQWVNELRTRCPGLHGDSIFITRPTQANRLCDKDRFDAVDLLDMRSAAQGMCVLGMFKPVTAAQVKEIEDRMAMR